MYLLCFYIRALFCKLQVIFKNERKLSNMLRFKDCVSYNLVSRVVDAIVPIMMRHLKVRSSEHIWISTLTFKKTKPSKESSIRNHLLECNNNSPSFDELTILSHGNKKYLLEIKESLLIKRDQPVLNKNISSATLHLMSLVSY